jgi:hypothetical protein
MLLKLMEQDQFYTKNIVRPSNVPNEIFQKSIQCYHDGLKRNKYNHIQSLPCGFCNSSLIVAPRNWNFCDLCGGGSPTLYRCSTSCDYDVCKQCYDVEYQKNKKDLGNSSVCLHEVVEGWKVSQCADCGKDLGETVKNYEMEQAAIASQEDIDYAKTNNVQHAERLHCFGVDISWLLEFTWSHDCWQVPTWQVVRDIIKPATRDRNRCRYSSLPEMSSWIGPADVFMSHCWGALWGDLVMASCVGASKSRKVWIDIFAVRQWPGNVADLDFRGVISRCKAVIVATTTVNELCDTFISKDRERIEFLETAEGQHSRRCIAFFRLWCVVELAAAINLNKPVIIKAGIAKKSSSSLDMMAFDTDGVETMLRTLRYMVDLEDSACAVKADKIREMNIIRSMQGGIDRVNRSVSGVVYGAACSNQHQTFEVDAYVCGEKQSLYYHLNHSVTSHSFTAVFHRMLTSAVGCGRLNCFIDLIHFAEKNKTKQWICDHIHQTNCAYLATSGEHFDVLKKIISIGPSRILANEHNEDNQSILYIMSQNNSINAMKWLLNLNVIDDINIQDIDGATPLSISSEYGHTEIVKMLLDHGADVNIPRNNGDTCLISACFFGRVDVVQLLLQQNNINIDSKDNSLMTAYNHVTALMELPIDVQLKRTGDINNYIKIKILLLDSKCDITDAPLDDDDIAFEIVTKYIKEKKYAIDQASVTALNLLDSLRYSSGYIYIISLIDWYMNGKKNMNYYSLILALTNNIISFAAYRLTDNVTNVANITIIINCILGSVNIFMLWWNKYRNIYKKCSISMMFGYILYWLYTKVKIVKIWQDRVVEWTKKVESFLEERANETGCA